MERLVSHADGDDKLLHIEGRSNSSKKSADFTGILLRFSTGFAHRTQSMQIKIYSQVVLCVDDLPDDDLVGPIHLIFIYF